MTAKMKVLITLSHLGPRVVPVVRQLEAQGFEVETNLTGRPYSEAELIAALPGVFATIAAGDAYTEAVFHA